MIVESLKLILVISFSFYSSPVSTRLYCVLTVSFPSYFHVLEFTHSHLSTYTFKPYSILSYKKLYVAQAAKKIKYTKSFWNWGQSSATLMMMMMEREKKYEKSWDAKTRLWIQQFLSVSLYSHCWSKIKLNETVDFHFVYLSCIWIGCLGAGADELRTENQRHFDWISSVKFPIDIFQFPLRRVTRGVAGSNMTMSN